MTQDFRSIGLKAQYNFQEWVVGLSNHIPAKACLEVAKAPGDSYNPLFIYGASGTGKTHLVQAVAQAMLKGNPDLRVKYISAERFMNEVISAIAEDNVLQVRDRYSNLDLLIVDDVQFLMESKSAQAEFFHIFNNLHQDNHQIVVTADRPPNQLTHLDKTILSRFEWGLSTEIKKPDVRARKEILNIKKAKYKLNLSEEMIKYVAGMLKSNARELEGFLKKVNAYVTFSHQELTIELVKSVIREILPEGLVNQDPDPLPDDDVGNSKQAQAEQAEVEEVNQVIQQVQNGPRQSVPVQPSNQSTGTASPAEPPRQSPGKRVKQELEVLMPNIEDNTPVPPEPPPAPPDNRLPTEERKEEAVVPPPESSVPSNEPEKDEESAPAAPPAQTPPAQEEKNDTVEVPPEIPEPPDGPAEEEEELPNGHKEVSAVFFYPEGGKEALENVYSKFQEVIKKHKLKFRLKRASSKEYKCDAKINYAIFVDACKTNKVPVAIVIGPPPSAFIPEQDFYDLLSVTLDVQGISLQLVNWAEINKDYRYLNLALDIALVRSR